MDGSLGSGRFVPGVRRRRGTCLAALAVSGDDPVPEAEAHDAAAVEMLRRACAIVDAAGVPEPLLPLAFERALDWVSGGVASRAGTGAPLDPAVPVPSERDLLMRIAHRLGVDLAIVQTVFVAQHGRLVLALGRDDLPRSRAPAMRQVALLLSVARAAAGLGETTSFELLREACADLDVLDSANAAAEFRRLGMAQAPGAVRALRPLDRHRGDAAVLLREIVARRASRPT